MLIYGVDIFQFPSLIPWKAAFHSALEHLHAILDSIIFREPIGWVCQESEMLDGCGSAPLRLRSKVFDVYGNFCWVKPAEDMAGVKPPHATPSLSVLNSKIEDAKKCPFSSSDFSTEFNFSVFQFYCCWNNLCSMLLSEWWTVQAWAPHCFELPQFYSLVLPSDKTYLPLISLPFTWFIYQKASLILFVPQTTKILGRPIPQVLKVWWNPKYTTMHSGKD